MQRTDTVKEPWMPVPYDQFDHYLKTDSLKSLIVSAISNHTPSVIFTLDDVMGGYGHPEHTCVSKLVREVCEQPDSVLGYMVARIYQPVFTPEQNEKILKNNAAYIAAKKIYNLQSSPAPDVAIDIVATASQKKEVMQAYGSQQRNIKKIWPYYNWYPSWVYFRIFDKEYFRVIDIQREREKNYNSQRLDEE